MKLQLWAFILLSTALVFPVLAAHAASNEDGLITKHMVIVPVVEKSNLVKRQPQPTHHSLGKPQIQAATTPPPLKPAVQTILAKSLWAKNAMPKRENIFAKHHLFLVTIKF